MRLDLTGRATAPAQDGIVPLGYERDLADTFPSATFRAIPDAAHFPHIEQPDLVLAEIEKFRAGAGR